MTTYSIPFDPRTLRNVDGSDVIQDVLKRLERLMEYKNPNSVIIKGGLALTPFCISQGIEHAEIRDIDLIFPYYGNLSDNIYNLINREKELKESLNDILDPETMAIDIEPLKIKGDTRIHSTIFGTRDLTINQVYMSFDKNTNNWNITYSTKCWRDIKERIGMIIPYGNRMTRIDYGRMIPTNRGFYRLMRAWVSGKVEAIWLPEWQLETHLAEMKRIGQEPLGNYLFLIAKQYENENPNIQERWIKILKRLSFTESDTFEDLVKQANAKKGFIFTDKKIPFEQTLNDLIEETRTRQMAMWARQTSRDACHHSWKASTCNDCGYMECVMQRCIKPGCTAYILPKGVKKADDLRCNENFITGNRGKTPQEDIMYL